MRVFPNHKWGVTRWSAVRSDGFLMALFATEAAAYAYYDKFPDNGHFGSRSNDWRGHRLVIDEMNRRAEETR